MATLLDLLRYKKEVQVVDPRTNQVVKTVWVRVLGDMDSTNAYKKARLASAAKRAALRDPESDDYKDEVEGLITLPEENLKDIIKAARLSNVASEALSSVTRPDLPELDSVSVDPDAPSLEEIEKLDSLEVATEKSYSDEIDAYINARTAEVESLINALSHEDLVATAQADISTIVPFGVFLLELGAYKAFYGTFQDKDCKVREFSSIEDYYQLPKSIQDSLLNALESLEISGAEIKN